MRLGAGEEGSWGIGWLKRAEKGTGEFRARFWGGIGGTGGIGEVG